MTTKTHIKIDEEQGFQAGRAPEEPVFARELLVMLGVMTAPFARKQAEVRKWLDQHQDAGASLVRSLKRSRLI
jgi:hypothetical protein